MVPVPATLRYSRSAHLLYLLASLVPNYAPRFIRRLAGLPEDSNVVHIVRRKSEFDPHDPKSIAFAVLIPVLVLMSGLFAGLTLGYMSLDETQLNVLSISGTPKQQEYARKIQPIRKNGHRLLVTLLLANMIVNETLPIIADPILGGGVQSVVVSTVLIVIFAEIIPQSLFTRHGLLLGAKMAGLTRVLIYALGIIAWPVAKLLELVLGAHHGIIYRRAELKELIAMHDARATHGGDLKTDTVAIIGATLDLQEKVVRQAMTPIDSVFMLSIDAKLDHDLLKQICETGHSRVPVYEEVDVPASVMQGVGSLDLSGQTVRVKKIIGVLLVKHCVLLDPNASTPLRSLPLNKVLFVPNNEPLLGILDRFQEGRSHMAIVSRFSVEKAASVKKAVKRGLTQRLRASVGIGESSDSDSESDDKGNLFTRKVRRRNKKSDIEEGTEDGSTIKEDIPPPMAVSKQDSEYSEKDEISPEPEPVPSKSGPTKKKTAAFQLPKGRASSSVLEQSMPADAVLGKANAAQFLQGFDPAIMPLGIITLEDVLEELIGEEIYDEFDSEGAHDGPHAYEKPRDGAYDTGSNSNHLAPPANTHTSFGLRGFAFFRTRSAPPVQRESSTGSRPEETRTHTTASGSIQLHDRDVDEPAPAYPTIQMPRPMRTVVGRGVPSIVLERNSTSDSAEFPTGKDIADVRLHQAENDVVDRNEGSVLGAVSLSMPTTTSPSLEAVLLERKRRMAAAGGTSSAAVSGTHTPVTVPGTPVVGGGRALFPLEAQPSSDGGHGGIVRSPSPSGSQAGTTSRPHTSHGHGKGGRFKSEPLNPSKSEGGGD